MPFDDLDHPIGDLDDLIDDTIRTALERGYTLQELRKRVRERLLIVPPDHVLIIEDEPGMRRLLRQGLSDMLPLLTIEATSPDKLVGNQGPVIGALVVTLPGRVWNLVAGNPSWILASCVSKVWWAFGEQYDPKRAKKQANTVALNKLFRNGRRRSGMLARMSPMHIRSRKVTLRSVSNSRNRPSARFF